MTEQDRPQVNFTRRRFLRFATYGSFGVALGSMLGSTAVYGIGGEYYSGVDKLRPIPNQVRKAKLITADFQSKAEDLAKAGRVNELPQSIDSDSLKSAYSTIDQDKHPEKYHPEEIAKLSARQNEQMEGVYASISLAFFSIVASFVGSILSQRIDNQPSNPEANPPRFVSYFLKPSKRTS